MKYNLHRVDSSIYALMKGTRKRPFGEGELLGNFLPSHYFWRRSEYGRHPKLRLGESGS